MNLENGSDKGIHEPRVSGSKRRAPARESLLSIHGRNSHEPGTRGRVCAFGYLAASARHERLRVRRTSRSYVNSSRVHPRFELLRNSLTPRESAEHFFPQSPVSCWREGVSDSFVSSLSESEIFVANRKLSPRRRDGFTTPFRR